MRTVSSHQQKRYFRQIIFYFFLLILVVVFIATVGIKLIINLTLFIADITHPKIENSLPKTQETEIIFPPEISELPSATNSSKIKISGSARGGKNLSIFVNDQLQKEVVLQDDSFETEIDLNSSQNSIYLVLENPQTKEKKHSNVYTVIYKSEKPKLEITSPEDQKKISKDEVEIVGQTEKEIFIKINDLPVVVDAEGKFSYNLKLKEGENKILVEAQDIAGNIETKELTVIYQKEE
jgi:hypothetical protein